MTPRRFVATLMLAVTGLVGPAGALSSTAPAATEIPTMGGYVAFPAAPAASLDAESEYGWASCAVDAWASGAGGSAAPLMPCFLAQLLMGTICGIFILDLLILDPIPVLDEIIIGAACLYAIDKCIEECGGFSECLDEA